MGTTTTPSNDLPLSHITRQINGVVGVLAAANVAIPIIVTVVTSVVGIVKTLRGTAPDLAPIIADIEKQVAANATRGAAELARLREIAAQDATRPADGS